jgi:hypothetical protein
MNIIKVTKERLTRDEAAQMLGLKVYDIAIPQQWLDDLYLKMSITPAGRLGQLPEGWKDIILSSLVWCYDKDGKGSPSIFGYPVVMTMRAFDLLNKESILFYVWDFSKQDAVLEIPEPQKEEDFILEGYEPIRYTVKAVNQEEAEKKFRAKYPKARITSLKIKLGSHISYTKNQPKE